MKTIVIKDERIVRMEKEAKKYEKITKDYESGSVNCEKNLKGFKDTKELLNAPSIKRFLVNKRVDKSFLKEVRRLHRKKVDDSDYHIKLCREDIKYYNRNIISYREAADAHLVKLKNLQANSLKKTLTLDDVKASLANFPTIDEEKTTFHTIIGIPYVTLFYHDVVSTPNTIKYANILDKDWVLPPLRIVFNLFTGLCTVWPEYEDTPVPKAWCSTAPHPHIMYDRKPCYGDFLGAANDAKEHLDVVQMATIMQLFLEQTNTVDDAGAHYPKFMFLNGSGGYEKDQISACRSYQNHFPNVKFYGRKFNWNGEIWWFIPVVEDGITSIHKFPDKADGRTLENFLRVLKGLPKIEKPVKITAKKLKMPSPSPIGEIPQVQMNGNRIVTP